MHNSLKLNIGVALVICLVSLLYMAPLVAQLGSAIPGTKSDHDVATMVWNVGWVKAAIEDDKPLLRTDDVLIPDGADLRQHTYGVVQGLIAYPFTLIFDVPTAFNFMLIITVFLNGAFLYALFKGEVQLPYAALVATVWTMLGFPIMVFISTGRPAFASIWIVAGTLIMMRRIKTQPNIGQGVLLGGLLILAMFSDLQILLFAAFWLGWYGLTFLRQFLSWAHFFTLIIAGIVAGIPFMLVFYPAFHGNESYPLPRLVDIVLYSYRYWDYLHPFNILRVYGVELYLCGLVGAVFYQKAWRWLVGGMVLLLLALGPYWVTHQGITNVKLPFAYLVGLWEPLGNFRTPNRLAMPALIGFGMIAAHVVTRLEQHLSSRRYGKVWLMGFLVLTCGLRLYSANQIDPLHAQTYPDHPIYHEIGAMEGNFAILEVPFGVRSGFERIGEGGEVLQYYQHIHGKRLLNGMVARFPSSTFAFYRTHPSLVFLAGEPVTVSEEDLVADLRDVLAWSEARFILVHTMMLTVELEAQIIEFLGNFPEINFEGEDANGLLIFSIE